MAWTLTRRRRRLRANTEERPTTSVVQAARRISSKTLRSTYQPDSTLLNLPLAEVLEATGHVEARELDEPYDAGIPEWARLIPRLSEADRDVVRRMVESLAANPVIPDEPPSPEATQ